MKKDGEYTPPTIRIVGCAENVTPLIAAAPAMSYRQRRHLGQYQVFSMQGGVKLYKSVRSAIDYNSDVPKHHRTYVSQERLDLSAANPPLVLYFRPEDLEPANVTADERIAFLKAQVDKWLGRLLESGLSDDELAVYFEDQFLAWGEKMKQHLGRDSV